MRILAGALLGLLLPGAAFATTLSTDYTDLWFIPSESGWGVNLAQQNDTIVATLFVYDGAGQPLWMIAPNTVLQNDGTFKGPLYVTTGTFYYFHFNPGAVTVQQVGNLTFAPTDFDRGTLTYNVGGRIVTKNVSRQSWRSDNLTGYYIGAREGNWSGCGSLDGRVDSAARIGVTHTGTNVIISDNGIGYSCTYTGTAYPRGRYTEIIGTGICDDQVVREFDATEVYASREALTFQYTLHGTGTTCNFVGYAGGIRRAP